MAIFYVNYETGSNTTTLTRSGIASNPSGTITRITSSSHGYANGDKIFLGGFSSWLNGIWTATNVATNTFDLQGAVWQATADTSGNCAKIVNGDTWGTAAKTVNRILANYSQVMQASDEIRIAKTAEPTSIGNATWTSKSITVTLATAQTTLIDEADSGWVAAAGGDITVSTNTTRKSGTARTILTFDATPQTNIKQAYKTLPAALNLSAYDSICFWFNPSAPITDNNRLKICLCSDTTGDTIVDEFIIPAIATSNANFNSLDLPKNGGGSLGTNINSIAVYSMGAAVSASSAYSLDNINACNANGLNLNTLIGKSSTAWTTDIDKMWYPIKSIDGTTVILDGSYTNTTMTLGTTLRGYYTTGTTPETVTTYILKPWQPPMDRTTSESSSNSYVDYHLYNTLGTASQQSVISGGWNTSNDTQDGITFVNGRGNGHSVIWCARDYTTWKRMGGMRFSNSTYSFYQGSGNSVGRKIYEIVGVANDRGVFMIGFNYPPYGYTLEDLYSVANLSPHYINYLDWQTLYPNSIKNWFIIGNGNQAEIAQTGIAALSIENFKIYNNGSTNTTQTRYTYKESNVGLNIDIYWKDIDIRDNTSGTFSCALSGDTFVYGNFPRRFINLTAKNNGGTLFSNNSNQSYSPVGIYPPFITFINADLDNNGSQPLNINANMRFYDSNNTATVKSSNNQKFLNIYASYDRFNDVENDNRIYWGGANAIQQSTTTYSGSGYAWQISITNAQYTIVTPLKYKISTIAFNANSLVTYKVWVKKSHATAIAASIDIVGGTIAGVTNDLQSTAADNTNWQELTLTFTPTKRGVVDIYLDTWVTASPYTNSVYVDNVTVTQA